MGDERTGRGPEIVAIAALAERDRLIGDGLELPWHLPADLRRFKRLTLGHPLVMGRRTFESLVHQFGGPLAGRENVVLTRSPEALRAKVEGAGLKDVHVFGGLPDALRAYEDRKRIYLGGGAAVYAAGLPLADRLELTLVEGSFEGDTYFPPYEHLLDGPFELAAREAHEPEEGRPGFRFETWVRAQERGVRDGIAEFNAEDR